MTETASSLCSGCRSPKASERCPLCQAALCRKCQEAPPRGAFAHQPEALRSERLKHPAYCAPCFDTEVVPALETYEQTLELARQVSIIPKNYKGHVRIQKKALQSVAVKDIEDRDEAILQIAYLA